MNHLSRLNFVSFIIFLTTPCSYITYTHPPFVFYILVMTSGTLFEITMSLKAHYSWKFIKKVNKLTTTGLPSVLVQILFSFCRFERMSSFSSQEIIQSLLIIESWQGQVKCISHHKFPLYDTSNELIYTIMSTYLKFWVLQGHFYYREENRMSQPNWKNPDRT